ncbi:MAG: KpsF/GutQ family sugar-phosphate isomerase [Bacteroidaceae bacterium]|nr:KpsF/GutQ family sugar-phosphate isomerase [Bacteroidaceae bacterium]MBQ2518783.1 KpsF/GutQ family sugar-phosphate isomerase [Bacteroidaceae bacterium]MBQ2595166.1 KpsF/GutQ family sugar-phosphate isomerase [Bacteroidaceae bacterium]MBQ3991814.1 KpsF/GutQ family sugar-phosphate isomerase [Bacteroidaceae bacterium]
MSQYRETARKCLQDEAQAILNVIPQLDESFDAAVRLILACKGKVVVTGVGKSGDIGAKMAATFSSTGTPSFYINPLDVFHGGLGSMTPDDVVIAISNSGQTDELLRFVPNLLERNIPLIGISGNADSLLARHATCHITVRVEEEACPLGLAPTSSTTATLATGDALACALMEARGFGERDFARFHPGGALGHRLLVTAQDVMRTDDLPIITPQMKLGEAIIRISNGMLGLGIAIENERIVGIITDGDVRRAVKKLQENFFNVPVSDAMTPNPVCVSPSTKVSQILDILNTRKIHAVLVVDENHRLQGVVDNFRCMI